MILKTNPFQCKISNTKISSSLELGEQSCLNTANVIHYTHLISITQRLNTPIMRVFCFEDNKQSFHT